MLTIRMKVDRTSPIRLAGRLYRMPERDARPLVEGGFAEWYYVPESAALLLASSEPEPKRAVVMVDDIGEGDE